MNGSIGTYASRSYIKKRVKAGRQVAYKDLEFDGDLRRAIQVGNNAAGETVIGFINDKARRIAGYQEDQTGEEIFSLTKAEAAAARRAFIKTYKQKTNAV